ncbi:hypothetical protein GGH91_006682, partial [Coemansia sp. RSA 2671]
MSQQEGVVIVTGASRGIGHQVCLNVLRTSAHLHVLAVSRSPTTLPTSSRLHQITGDITDTHTQAQIKGRLQALNQPILALVNNAATAETTGPFLDTTSSEWTHLLATNLTAALVLCSTCIEELKKSGGRIINVTSSASLGPIPGFSAYGMTKAALNYATKALALEYPEVTSVAFYPGVVDTDMHQVAVKAAAAYAANPRTTMDTTALTAKLSKPIAVDVPSAIIANLALRADRSLSGRYVA